MGRTNFFSPWLSFWYADSSHIFRDSFLFLWKDFQLQTTLTKRLRQTTPGWHYDKEYTTQSKNIKGERRGPRTKKILENLFEINSKVARRRSKTFIKLTIYYLRFSIWGIQMHTDRKHGVPVKLHTSQVHTWQKEYIQYILPKGIFFS